MSYEDAKHRPHAIHFFEEPRNPITYGPESLSVRLDRWGPVDNLFTSMFDALQSNWGDTPSRTVMRSALNHPIRKGDDRVEGSYAIITGWTMLDDDERDYVESCFAGKTLQQVLEGVTFDFCIDGVSRTFTHQNVRTRLGAGFMQHGGRDNDWRHRSWTMPETMARMCTAQDRKTVGQDTLLDSDVLRSAEGLKLEHCISDWEPIDSYIEASGDRIKQTGPVTMRDALEHHIMNCRKIYSAMVDAGIPWQDARRVLPIGMQTYIHDQYNYLALSGVLNNRLEHIMDWEFNCVAQLMLREIKLKCPPLISKYLGSASDKAKQAKFAGLESWPPDRKYPSPYDHCATCDHGMSNHRRVPIGHKEDDQWGVKAQINNEYICAVCERDGNTTGVTPMHVCNVVDRLPRQHAPEQMPFFVLHPSSMAGGPIQWIKTNGQYPHKEIDRILERDLLTE